MIDPQFLRGVTGAVGDRASNMLASRLVQGGGIKAIQQINGAARTLKSALGMDDRNVPVPLLGGYSLAESEAILDEMTAANLARSHFFLITVEDITPPPMNYGVPVEVSSAVPYNPVRDVLNIMSSDLLGMVTRGLQGAMNSAMGINDATAATALSVGVSVPHMFNLLGESVSYSTALGGEKVAVGGATLDKLIGAEPVELEFSTLDDEVGTIKRWFRGKQVQAVHRDGTVGLPDDYCVRITIQHGHAKASTDAYAARWRMRPASISHSLSRSGADVERLQMTFTQSDSVIE
ncbi:MAG: hypothetical protein ACKOXG_10895 [Arenimonas sp.]